MTTRMITGINPETDYIDLSVKQKVALHRWAKRQDDYNWRLPYESDRNLLVYYLVAKLPTSAALKALSDHRARNPDEYQEMVNFEQNHECSSEVSSIFKRVAAWDSQKVTEPVAPATPAVIDDDDYNYPHTSAPTAVPNDAALNALGELVSILAKNSMDEARVVELVKEHAPTADDIVLPAPTVIVKTEVKEIELTEQPRHEAFGRLLGLIRKVNVLLVGPAGGGKTTLGRQLTEALAEVTGNPWRFYHSTRVTHESQLLGYNDASGRFVETEFYRACTTPYSVFLLDETDATVPDAQTAMNTAVEGGRCPFACGTVEVAENVIIMASANTYGFGANAQYVGRYPLDGAFKNRWATFQLDYDLSLERVLARQEAEKFGHEKNLADAWVDHVQRLRAAKDSLGILHIISPRASIGGARCLELGFDELDDLFIWQGLDVATRTKIQQSI